jgi:hypothetical protein
VNGTILVSLRFQVNAVSGGAGTRFSTQAQKARLKALKHDVIRFEQAPSLRFD